MHCGDGRCNGLRIVLETTYTCGTNGLMGRGEGNSGAGV